MSQRAMKVIKKLYKGEIIEISMVSLRSFTTRVNQGFDETTQTGWLKADSSELDQHMQQPQPARKKRQRGLRRYM